MNIPLRLTPQILLSAYAQGIFPMAHDDGDIYWYDPNPRAIIPLDTFHVPRSLQRSIKKGEFSVRIDTAFYDVICACAKPAPGREKTWISSEIIEAYTFFHDVGFAHSVETWLEGRLVGGLYGVAIGGLFAGESMFSCMTDASKVALVHLVEHMKVRNFQLLDVQFMTDHLARFGAIEISRRDYKQWLAEALRVRPNFSEN